MKEENFNSKQIVLFETLERHEIEAIINMAIEAFPDVNSKVKEDSVKLLKSFEFYHGICIQRTRKKY